MSLSYSNLSTHLPLCLLIRKMKWEWVLKQCNNSDEGDKFLINIKQWTTIGNRFTQHDNHNHDFKINSAMILTFVFVYCHASTVSVNINKLCDNMYKRRGYVVVYGSKKRQVYCEYVNNVSCDGTVLRFSLPSCLLIGKIKWQWRLKQCNNVAVEIRTSLLQIW